MMIYLLFQRNARRHAKNFEEEYNSLKKECTTLSKENEVDLIKMIY